jgi:glyoxylate/hydroxypyruvate reductase A
MTRVALISKSAKLGYFAPLLRERLPGLDVVVWPEEGYRDAEVAVCWNAPAGVYAEMPGLRLIHSIAAGVDNVVAGQDTRGAPVCRVVDPGLIKGMTEYVLWSVLTFHRKLDLALANQRDGKWERAPQVAAEHCRVGVMGAGNLGSAIAARLCDMGYPVSVWSRSRREIEGAETFAGRDQFKDFLATTEILICLLPLTDETRGILCRETFDALPRGAAIVNCGRGEHLVVSDLVEALASGQLRGAVLDVFAHEPLAPEDPLWRTPGIVVTPHMASMASPGAVATQIADNIARLQAGDALHNEVDMRRGY